MIKPVVLTQEQVAEQLVTMKQERDTLQSTFEQLEHRIQLIENSLKENDQLKIQIKELIHVSTEHFLTEWKRKSEYFPEIRLSILIKTVEMATAAPPPPTKK